MTRLSLLLLGAASHIAIAGAYAFADGGQVRAVERHGDYEVTVFTSPTPLRAGAADISIGLQNITTGEICGDAEIVVELRHRDHDSPGIRATATNEAATNKFLKAALMELPEQGTWDVTVRVLDSGAPEPIRIHFAMEAAVPWPAWVTEWAWFCWPVIPILLFVIHRMLVAAHSNGHHDRISIARMTNARTAPTNLAART